jgi:hypothetical protein
MRLGPEIGRIIHVTVPKADQHSTALFENLPKNIFPDHRRIGSGYKAIGGCLKKDKSLHNTSSTNLFSKNRLKGRIKRLLHVLQNHRTEEKESSMVTNKSDILLNNTYTLPRKHWCSDSG